MAYILFCTDYIFSSILMSSFCIVHSSAVFIFPNYLICNQWTFKINYWMRYGRGRGRGTAGMFRISRLWAPLYCHTVIFFNEGDRTESDDGAMQTWPLWGNEGNKWTKMGMSGQLREVVWRYDEAEFDNGLEIIHFTSILRDYRYRCYGIWWGDGMSASWRNTREHENEVVHFPSSQKPGFIMFVGGLEKCRWIQENDRRKRLYKIGICLGITEIERWTHPGTMDRGFYVHTWFCCTVLSETQATLLNNM
jgi:hypothetical protein